MLFKEKEMGPNVISFSRSVHRKRRMGHDCCKTGIQAKTSSVWLSTNKEAGSSHLRPVVGLQVARRHGKAG